MAHPYETLDPDQIVDCIESLNVRSDLRLLALNSYENRVYQVGIEDSEPIIAKFYRPGRWSDAQILEEHAFSLELVEHGLSVIAPESIGGETLHQHDGWRFSVFRRRGGYPPELDNPDHLLILGRTLGRIHRIGAAGDFEHRAALKSARELEPECEWLLAHFVPRDLAPAYESLVQDCLGRVSILLADLRAEDTQRIHGDCHVGNILWRDDVAHFVDLDDCITGPVIQDLWMFLNGDRPQKELQLSELIAGYEEFNEFDPRQLHWIEALRTLRLLIHAIWLGRRWDDPAFPKAFPWFENGRFWSDHILELREQLSAMEEPRLRLL